MIQEKPLERATFCILDKYIPRIKELIIDGIKMKDIYQIIKEEGYKGKQTLFNSKITAIKEEIATNTKYLKRINLKKLLFKPLEDLIDGNIKDTIKEYLEINTEFKTIVDYIYKFKDILKTKNVRKLNH